MKTVNRVTLLGNATHDAELKSHEKKSLCKIGIATHRSWKDTKGEWQEVPEFHNLVCWGNLADFCAKNVRKGKPLFAEGYLKTSHWDNKGVRQSRTEIVVENVVLLGTRQAKAEVA